MKHKIIKYKYVHTEKVDDLLADGYELYGDPVYTPGAGAYQAMVLPEPNTDDEFTAEII